MTNEEKTKFENVINGLCGVFGVKQLDNTALSFWRVSLKDFDYGDVCACLLDWAKTEKFFPRPADIIERINAKNQSKKKSVMVDDEEPMPAVEVPQECFDELSKLSQKNVPSDAWAKRLMIKEAYGFILTPFVRQSWRRALRKDPSYNFEDTRGVFPLNDVPDQRRSLYHECQTMFIREFENVHGLQLKFDKKFEKKQFFSPNLGY